MRLKHEGFHRYELRNIGKNKEYWVYHCNIPGCTHYKVATTQMMSNVMSLCNRCNEPFLWDKEANRKQVKPHCGSDKCKKKVNHAGLFKSKKPAVNRNAIDAVVGSILSSIGKPFSEETRVEREGYAAGGTTKKDV